MIIPNSYNEDISYDKNGNITSLWRNGDQDSDQAYVNAVDIDQLTYTYDDHKPNQLVKVMDISAMPQGFKDDSDGITDVEKDYNYDAFGNMTSDANKDIDSITYNHLNLPVSIVFGNGNSINYIYTATGQKMQKNVIDLLSNSGGVTDYLAGGFQYKDGQLKFFPHAEGYVNVTYGGRSGTSVYYDYVFNYTDHLGNIRMSYAYDFTTENVKILEETHYYPFGLKHTNYNSDVLFHQLKEEEEMVVLKGPGPTTPAGPFYKYKYNGKEYQDELGLNVYDYGWRQYDPAVGRFLRVDRFAEKYHQLTPYGYAGNNPVLYNDIQGDSIGVGKDLFSKFRNGVNDRKNNILNDRKSQIETALGKGNTDKAKSLEERFARQDAREGSEMSVLNATLKELSALEQSPQLYNLFENSNDVSAGANGDTVYDTVTGAVNISSKRSFSMGVFSHELKHAYQFDSGTLSFGSNGEAGGYLYDLNDEYEAFDRGTFFGGQTANRNDINLAYPNRPLGPINMTTVRGSSTYGKQLKAQTYNNSLRGTAQQQFYINWQNDKKK